MMVLVMEAEPAVPLWDQVAVVVVVRSGLRYSTCGFPKKPERPSIPYLRLLVPKTIPLMVFGTRVLDFWVLGPSGKKTRHAHDVTRLLCCPSVASGTWQTTANCEADMGASNKLGTVLGVLSIRIILY